MYVFRDQSCPHSYLSFFNPQAIVLVGQQIRLLPDESLAQLAESISAEQGQRKPKRPKKRSRHACVVSKLDNVCGSDFDAQLRLRPCLPSSQEGPPHSSGPDIPDASASSPEVSSQQVIHSASAFQLPSPPSGGPVLRTTSIGGIYQALDGLEKTTSTAQFFCAVVLHRIEVLVTKAYSFKKHLPEVIDYFVDVIIAERNEHESEKVRKLTKQGYMRYIRLGAKIDPILRCGGEGWLFGLSKGLTTSE